MIVVNGNSYVGNNITIKGNKVYTDGVLVDTKDSKVINITVDGNVENIDVDNCDKITVNGECTTINTTNGDVDCANVKGSVSTTNGDIDCGAVGGNVRTKNGDINHR